MKANIIYIALALLLIATVYNGTTNHEVDGQHQEFFTEVRAFMQGGGNRFTAADGMALQRQIEDLKMQVAAIKEDE